MPNTRDVRAEETQKHLWNVAQGQRLAASRLPDRLPTESS